VEKTGSVLPLSDLCIRYIVLASFIAIIVFIWLNELLDIPYLVFGAQATETNWKEALFETFLIAAIGTFVMTYLSRIKERRLSETDIKNRLELEKAISVLSARFVGASDLDGAIDDSLNDMGKLSRASRVYLFRFSKDGTTMSNTHEWCTKGVTAMMDILRDLPVDTFPWWMKRLREGKDIHIEDVSKMPEEARAERKILEDQAVKSVLVFPLYIGRELSGFIGFDNITRFGKWKDYDIKLLHISSEIIGNALDCRQAEENLIDNEKRLGTILNTSPIGIGLVKDRKMEWANKAMCRMLGYEEGAMEGKSARVFYVDQQEYERVGRKLYDLAETPEMRRIETVWVRKDGTLFDCAIRINFLDLEDPSRGQIVTVSDVSDLHRADKELQESEERYRSIFENTGAATVILEKDGTISMANAGFEKLSGHSRKEIEGEKKWFEYVDKQDIQWMKEVFAERRRGGTNVPTEYTFRFVDRQGTIKDVFIKAGMIPGTEKSVSSLIDITPIKQAEDRLRRSEEKYRGFFEASKDIVYIISAEGKIIDINDFGLKFFGIKREDLDKINVEKDIYADPAESAAFTKIIDKGGYIAAHETNLKKLDGTIFPATITAVSLKDKDGNIVGYQGVVRDETGRKRLEAQLAQAQKMEAIGTLAGGIAHDFNNILSAVMGYSELAKEDLDETSMACMHIDEVLNAAERARELVKQILTFSRRVEVEPRPVMVHLIVKEVMKLLRASIPTTIDIRQEISLENDTVIADPTHIHQIIMNLCANAFQSMEETGGVLYVGLERVDVDADLARDKPGLYEGAYIRLTVRDTGCGMDRATMERIFDPFFTTKEKGRGTGLGMSTVHGIVTAMGAYIDIESALGKGTGISVYLPSATAGEQDLSKVPNIVERGGGESILVVDDEQTIVESLKEMLGRIGYSVTGEQQSKHALEIFRRDPGRFDIVLTDYAMPRMTGIQLAREIMKVRPDIPIILMTGFIDNIDISRAKAEGIAGFVEKPFSYNEMAYAIHEVLHSAI